MRGVDGVSSSDSVVVAVVLSGCQNFGSGAWPHRQLNDFVVLVVVVVRDVGLDSRSWEFSLSSWLLLSWLLLMSSVRPRLIPINANISNVLPFVVSELIRKLRKYFF